MTDEQRIQHNMKYLGLTKRRVEIHDVLMSIPMKYRPESLIDLTRRYFDKYAYCADVHAVAIAEWIKGNDEI